MKNIQNTIIRNAKPADFEKVILVMGSRELSDIKGQIAAGRHRHLPTCLRSLPVIPKGKESHGKKDGTKGWENGTGSR